MLCDGFGEGWFVLVQNLRLPIGHRIETRSVSHTEVGCVPPSCMIGGLHGQSNAS